MVDPVRAALDVELRRLDAAILRAWLVLAVSGIVASCVVAGALAFRLGVALAVMCAAMTAFFAGAYFHVTRAPLGARPPAIFGAVEGAMPCLFFGVLSYAQGATYALASWIPPMLFAALIVASIVRLDPIGPLLVSVSSALGYLAVYFLVVRPALASSPVHSIVQDPPMQITRAATFLVGGFLASRLVGGMRSAVARLEEALLKTRSP